jgi:ankyrin repeat protein
LKNKADIEAKSLNGYTPLQKATLGNYLSIVKLLVEANCLVNETNCWLRTATLLAAKNGFLDVLKFLLSNKGDLFAREKFEHTALHLASMNSFIVNGKVIGYFKHNVTFIGLPPDS